MKLFRSLLKRKSIFLKKINIDKIDINCWMKKGERKKQKNNKEIKAYERKKL